MRLTDNPTRNFVILDVVNGETVQSLGPYNKAPLSKAVI